jgi:signal transduction histidine kinase
MTFRSRLLVALVAVSVIPLTTFALRIRSEMIDRLTVEYEKRAVALMAVVRDDLQKEDALLASRLTQLTRAMGDDNGLRLAAAGGGERQYLLDYAGSAMRLMGLAMLQIQDATGAIVSSGHFRNEFGRQETGLPRAIADTPGGYGLVSARSAEGPFFVVARSDSVRLAGRRYDVTGGLAVGDRFLQRLVPDEGFRIALALEANDSAGPPAHEHFVGDIRIPYIGAPGEVSEARLIITQNRSDLVSLTRSVNLWFLLVVTGTVGFAVVCAVWLSSLMSKPIAELARKTEAIDLDKLDVDFTTRRHDEVGALARLMGAMTTRLKSSASKLRDAERRATVGDLARQVNHDIKNGLIPIRNVLRHLNQVSDSGRENLGPVFEERRGTLDASVAYLETLAQNYARLYPSLDRQPCDANEVIHEVVESADSEKRRQIHLDLNPDIPPVLGDAIVLRRILENLVGNALDSLDGHRGTVTVETSPLLGNGAKGVRITVTDTGRGMHPEELDRVFDDFYSTKTTGTGLGLSIVRRLILDLNGSVRVETEPDVGSRFIVELPAAEHGP